MAHLGSQVSSFVDGQLSPDAMRDAETHLVRCQQCEHAVRQQRLLKSRMGTVPAPAVSPDLMASLSSLAAVPPDDGWWARVCRTAPMRAGLVLVSASMAVAVLAYVVGAGADGTGDPVLPPYDEYTAAFAGTVTSPMVNASVVSDQTVDRLTRDGYPCHSRLAGDLERSEAAVTDVDQVVALTYTNGDSRMNLYEQNGRLDADRLEGFTRRTWGESSVWVRPGDATLVTWDVDGVVYTMVTDADESRIRAAVDELPTSARIDPVTRVGDGLSRLTSWVTAA